ncbi:TonB-dependent receptor plug domain-containing protein, partial [candidate division KSB1 bacterium]|nr:TonB-dependent receptor plug domain-containing protein [candidate division KSB1 bacterium]
MLSNKQIIFIKVICLLSFLPILCFLGKAYGQEPDLSDLSIPELMELEVVTASRKSVKVSDVSAAISVITADDIRNAGARTVPEALRLVPGLQVARIDANKWAISCRGFNGVFANKLLVLINGRSVYTPLFSGVFWDSQNIPLNEIDRIEVIRGPGASLWGSNAVNGIINIITRSAAETTDEYASIGSGTENTFIGYMRHGSSITENLHYRVYGRYFDHDNFVDSLNSETNGAWDMLSAGFRMDWEATNNALITFQGDIYHENLGQMSRIIQSAG